ncbi:hypothetical protein EDF70_10551 [Neorhizobium sp. JUb45]|nr:hypothetical protein EDF70_10551 [Neorhizobium sp. JUb45]
MMSYGPIIIAVSVIVFYLYLKARVSAFVEPARLALLERADELLSRHDLTTEHRRVVCFGVENAYSTSFAWMMAIGFLPSWIYHRLIGGKAKVVPVKRAYDNKITAFHRLVIISAMGSSPAAMLVFMLSLLIAVLTYVPYKRALELFLIDKAAHAAERPRHAASAL